MLNDYERVAFRRWKGRGDGAAKPATLSPVNPTAAKRPWRRKIQGGPHNPPFGREFFQSAPRHTPIHRFGRHWKHNNRSVRVRPPAKSRRFRAVPPLFLLSNFPCQSPKTELHRNDRPIRQLGNPRQSIKF